MVLVAAGSAMVGSIRASVFSDQDRLLVGLFWLGLAAGIVVDRHRGCRFRYAMLCVLLAMALGYYLLHTSLWHAYWHSNYTPGRLRHHLPEIIVMLFLCAALAVPLAALFRLITALLAAGPRGWRAGIRSHPRMVAAVAAVGAVVGVAYGAWSYWEANCTWQEASSFIAFPNDPGYRHPADKIAVSREGDWIAVSGIRHHLRNSPEVRLGQIAICHWQDGPQALPEPLQEHDGKQDRTVSFSPDADQLMVADGTATLRVIDPEQGAVARELALESPAFAATWLNDGKFFTRPAYIYDTISLRNLADVSAAPLVPPVLVPPPHGSGQFTDPTARHLVQNGENQMVVSRLSGQSRIMTIGNRQFLTPSFSQDGRLMILDRTLCDLDTGDQVELPRRNAFRCQFVSRQRVVSQAGFPEVLMSLGRVSPWLTHVPLIMHAGRLCQRSRIVLFDPQTGRIQAQTRLFREPIYSIGVSHDGRVMAAMIGERIYVWDVPD